MTDSYNARTKLYVKGKHYDIYRLNALQERFDIDRLPF